MSVKYVTEVTCDQCGDVEQFYGKTWTFEARSQGWRMKRRSVNGRHLGTFYYCPKHAALAGEL